MTKILIIDDSSFQRKVMAGVLQDAGYSLATADNGKDGLARIGTENPDLLITDLLMPEYDGFYVLEKAKELKVSLPILIVTSDIQNTTRSKCLALGAAGVVNKPVKKETLLPAVQKVLSGEKL